MDAAIKRVTEGLQTAIRTESDGYHFYTMAAISVQDPKGKEVFTRLAQDELSHLRFLNHQYQSFMENGKPDEQAQLGPRAEWAGDNPIFSEKIHKRLDDAHFEMSALSIGIQLELTSEQFYRAEARAAKDPAVKKFYTELADWESDHYHALLKQQESLKEDYWAKGGFAPF
ncbi:ferritin family protein [Myxococcota bacterium]